MFLKNPFFWIILVIGLTWTYISISNLFDKRYSQKAEGEIISIYDKKPYITFYVNGEKYVFQSDYSASSMKVGDKVRVKYDPANPNRAKTDTFLSIFFKFAGLAMGLLILGFASLFVVDHYQKTSQTKLHNAAAPTEQIQHENRDNAADYPKTLSEYKERFEAAKAQKAQNPAGFKNMLSWWLLIPLLLFVFAFFHFKTPIELRITGIKTEGVYDGWDKDRKMPVISFQDDMGKKYSFTSSYKPGDFVEGDKVPVLYKKNNPAKACTAWFGEMGGGFIAIGVALLFFLFYFLIKNNSQ
jgi:ATP-dependent Zn protease